jgi:hypothetical protein
MSEWWTYTLSDLILFSARAYYRLFELYNAAIWPAQVLAIVLGLAVLELARRGGVMSRRWTPAILAACWLWVGLAFHAARYATLNTAAPAFAWLFGLEAALLFGIGVAAGRMSFDRPAGAAGRVGLAIFLFALFVLPFASPVLGRGWRAAEIFGVAPDPTAIGTLGILLLARAKARWLLMIVPAAWCVVTGAILYTLKSPDFWIAPLAAAIAVVLAAWPRRRWASR